MVQRLAAGGIESPLVLQAMGQVPRHGFVDSALVAQAYEDTSLPIGWQQTISKPSVVARMIELLPGAPLAQQHGLGGCWRSAPAAATRQRCCPKWRERCTRSSGCAICMKNLVAICRRCAWQTSIYYLGDGTLGYAQGGPYAESFLLRGDKACPRRGAISWRWRALGGPCCAKNGQQMLLVLERSEQGFTESVSKQCILSPKIRGVA